MPGELSHRDEIEAALERATFTAHEARAQAGELADDDVDILASWAGNAAGRRDRVLAPLFEGVRLEVRHKIAEAARLRVASGPMIDALASLPATGDGSWLKAPEHWREQARVDLLLWEAGAGALSLPALGTWMWQNQPARHVLLSSRARGNLRERTLAARALEVSMDGMANAARSLSAFTEARLIGLELADHPEPIVWIPAVRALGRLAGSEGTIRMVLEQWYAGDVLKRRRRAVTALASMPDGEWLESHLDELIGADDPWLAAAVGPATPILRREYPDFGRRAVARLLATDQPPILWSLTQGLVASCRHEDPDAHTEATLLELRRRAERDEAGVTVSQLWAQIRTDTDFLLDLPTDPSFLDIHFDRAVSDALRVGAENVADRVVSLVERIVPTFDSCLERTQRTEMKRRDRARALTELESCGRALAVALYQPLLTAAGRQLNTSPGFPTARLSELLSKHGLDFSARRAVIRAFSSAIDAVPVGVGTCERTLRAGAALAALVRSDWALSAKPRELKRLRRPISDLVWRLSHSFRAKQGDSNTFEALVAWSVLAVGNADLLMLVADDHTAERNRLERTVAAITGAPEASASGTTTAIWTANLWRALAELGMAESTLAYGVESLAATLLEAERAVRSNQRGLGDVIRDLSGPVGFIGAILENPGESLVSARESGRELAPVPTFVTATEAWLTGSDEPITLVLDPWRAALGPILGPACTPVLSAVFDRAHRARRATETTETIGPYEKLKLLGKGGGGEVWLVRRPGSRRRWVLKYPVGLASADTNRRNTLNRSLEAEARLLESLHVAKVATYHDHGWEGRVPYLVLEYLIGADLERYVKVRRASLEELRPIVRDVCIGLHALHDRGIVHLDLKPGNIFLRLHLPKDAAEVFDESHRDPSVAPITDAVLIDFGISALIKDATQQQGASGTLGFMSPEQAHADEPTPAADIYALGATIYTALTGRRLFEQATSLGEYILAHAKMVPFEDFRVQRTVAESKLPAALVQLLSEATALSPRERPSLREFVERFDRATATG